MMWLYLLGLVPGFVAVQLIDEANYDLPSYKASPKWVKALVTLLWPLFAVALVLTLLLVCVLALLQTWSER